MTATKKLCLFAAVAALVMALCAGLGGCQSAAFQAGDYTGQGLNAEYQTTGTPGYIIITHRDGTVQIIPLPTQEVRRVK
jgi:hypothetical protein